MENIEEFFFKKIPVLGSILKWMNGNDMDYGPVAFGLATTLLFATILIFDISAGNILSVFISIAPVWLPIVLFLLLFNKWNDTVGTKFYLNQGRTTLRIKLPMEVTKSPEAMEFVIAQIHNTANPDNLFQTYQDGKRPLPFSFEIVSIGGEVRFYVNVPTKKTKNAFEANMYAQYPGVEIIEEPVDYAAEVPLDFEKHDYEVMSFHMGKKKAQEFPIKTYIEFGLDKMPKEEEKVDPITPMLEVLAMAEPHERIYIQYIAKPFRVSSFKNGQLMFGESESWEKEVEKEVNEILKRDPQTKLSANRGVEDEEGGYQGGNALITAGERDKIEAMERNAGKYAYETNIRWMYITKKGKFNGDIINPIIRVFSQYDIIGRNAIGVRWRTDFNYKDYIPGGKRKTLQALKKQELKEYKLRKFFPKNALAEPKIFTAEELATIWHLPGQVALTPTLNRIESQRSEAPSNLPV